MACVLSNGHVTDDVTWPWKVKLVTPIRLKCNIKLLELETSNLVCSFVWGMPSVRTKISPKSGRGLGHVTPTILAVRSAILATAWLLVFLFSAHNVVTVVDDRQLQHQNKHDTTVITWRHVTPRKKSIKWIFYLAINHYLATFLRFLHLLVPLVHLYRNLTTGLILSWDEYCSPFDDRVNSLRGLARP